LCHADLCTTDVWICSFPASTLKYEIGHAWCWC
jgi:hypothetical protein